MVLSFLIFLGSPAFAAFLTLSETSSTEMKMPPGAPPQMAAMMKQYAPKPESKKIYVSGGNWASVDARHSSIIDFGQEIQTYVDHIKKTYSQTPLDYWIDHSPMGKNMEEAQISGSHQDLKRSKKILGKTCQMVLRTFEFSGMGKTNESKDLKGKKFKMQSQDCVLVSAPSAWQEYMVASEKYWKLREKKLKKKFKSFDLDNQWVKGLVLFSAMKSDMAAAVSPEQAKMIPKSTHVTKVTALSEKPFALSVFQPPKGYKKVDPQY